MNDDTRVIAVDLTTADWVTIDEVLDTLASIAAEELELWPSAGQRSLIGLALEQWAFVIDALAEDAEVSEQITAAAAPADGTRSASAAAPADDSEDADSPEPDWTRLATEARALAAYLSAATA